MFRIVQKWIKKKGKAVLYRKPWCVPCDLIIYIAKPKRKKKKELIITLKYL